MTPKQEELHTLYFQLSEVQRDIANADLQEACRSTICSLRQLEEDFTEEIRLLTDFREPQYCAAGIQYKEITTTADPLVSGNYTEKLIVSVTKARLLTLL